MEIQIGSIYKVKKEITFERLDAGNKKLFRNLLNLYHYDLAGHSPQIFDGIDEKGYYDRHVAEEYSEAPADSVFPAVIRYGRQPVGLLVYSTAPFAKEGCDYCIQELFITHPFRGKRLGRKVCEQIFAQAKGRYCLMVVEHNRRAAGFWEHLIMGSDPGYTKEKLADGSWVYEFEVY